MSKHIHNHGKPVMSLKIPCSPWKIKDGSVVILSRFPSTKWILKNGWYTYLSGRYHGGYFSSIPAQTVIPVNQRDLMNLTVLSGGVQDVKPRCNCGCCEICLELQNYCADIDDLDCDGGCPYPPVSSVTKQSAQPNRCCPQPFPPKAPHPPAQPKRSIEMYMRGVNYVAGQVVWLTPGKLYQVTRDFRSSFTEAGMDANMEKDIKAGFLVPCCASFGGESTNSGDVDNTSTDGGGD
jgi:hypothetical protein